MSTPTDLADEVALMVHAFSDKERRDEVRSLAARIRALAPDETPPAAEPSAAEDMSPAECGQTIGALRDDVAALREQLAARAPISIRDLVILEEQLATVTSERDGMEKRGDDHLQAWRKAEAETPVERRARLAEYERRVQCVLRILDQMEQRFPYTDNVAQRIVQWAERGFEGEV
jgi:hypothetical protein